MAFANANCSADTSIHSPIGLEVSYRAIRLGSATRPGSVAACSSNGLPLENLLVFVSPQGFRSTDPVTDQETVHEGWFHRPRRTTGWHSCAGGGDQQRPIPVAILDDRPVAREMTVAADSEVQQFDLDVRNARQWLHILRRLSEQNRQIETLLAIPGTRTHSKAFKPGRNC